MPPASFRPLARVLVSDDDPDIRQIYATLLLQHGFAYLGASAGDGPATLALALRARPHLLITDVNKPGLDGHALRDALRADPRTAKIPVLTVTAMEPWSAPRRAAPSPLDDYFLKPFSFEALLYRVVALLPLDAAGHDGLVERAQRLPCYEHFHPVTGLPCLHTLANRLPEATAAPGWAALSVELAAFPRLVRGLGRPAADGLLARLGGIVRGAAGPQLLAAHPGFDARIALVGHSAGGHLATMLMSCRWKDLGNDLPAAPVAGALSISGLYDLEPLRHVASVQTDLKLSPAAVSRLSPAFFPRPKAGKLYAAVGAEESDEFLRQNRLIRDVWGPTAVPVCETVPGKNHFTVLESLADPAGRLHELALRLLGLR